MREERKTTSGKSDIQSVEEADLCFFFALLSVEDFLLSHCHYELRRRRLIRKPNNFVLNLELFFFKYNVLKLETLLVYHTI